MPTAAPRAPLDRWTAIAAASLVAVFSIAVLGPGIRFGAAAGAR